MIHLSKKIIGSVGRTNAKYKMFEENDKILLALSGGKDSIVLAHLLKHFQMVSPLKWDFTAVRVSYGIDNGMEFLIEHCKENDIKYEIIDSKIFEILEEKTRKNSSFCSFCSRMRRGYLYTYALNNGYNKVAIAHHLDDAVESFFMNLTHNGAIRTLAPKYRADNGLIVIRPLILTRERQIIDTTIKNEIKVADGDCNCPAKRFSTKMPHAREETKNLLNNLEKENPKLFISIKAAFENIHSDTFFMEDNFLKSL